jgi:hypothetical protein
MMPVNVRGAKSREQLLAELKRVRAAFVSIQRNDRDPELELHAVTERLKELCAQSAQEIEAERASWAPWSPR